MSRPAPTDSISASAISATTSVRCSARCGSGRRPPADRRATARPGRVPDACSAGAVPNSRPAISDTASANSMTRVSTRISETRGMINSPSGSSARVRHDAEGDPERAAGEAQQGGLRQQLPRDPRTSGAERRAHRDLTLARRRACQQQVGDVRQRDQQQDPDRAEQQVERRARVADQRLGQRHCLEAPVCRDRAAA